jgi:hypothetical protein
MAALNAMCLKMSLDGLFLIAITQSFSLNDFADLEL